MPLTKRKFGFFFRTDTGEWDFHFIPPEKAKDYPNSYTFQLQVPEEIAKDIIVRAVVKTENLVEKDNAAS